MGWLVAVTFVTVALAGQLAALQADELTTVLGRASLFALWGVPLLVLVVLLAAHRGRRRVVRDTLWLGSRRVSAVHLAWTQLAGIGIAALATAGALALAVEARLPDGPGFQVVERGRDWPLESTTVLFGEPLVVHFGRAVERPSRAHLAWGLGPARTRDVAVSIRPFDAQGSELGSTHFMIGGARSIPAAMPAGAAGFRVRVESGAGARLHLEPSWLASEADSTRVASLRLATHWLLLTLGFAALAFGLAHHMATPLATLLALTLALPFFALIARANLWPTELLTAIRTTADGLLPGWPSLGPWAALAAGLTAGFLLALPRSSAALEA